MTTFSVDQRSLAGTITPNRTEVTRSFPVLGFTIRTGKSPSWFEVALANDPALLRADGAARRTRSNFWSSRSLGPLEAAQGESVFLVPGPALARFAGSTQLYFALACFERPDRSDPQVWIPDPDAAPSVAISASYTGHRRVTLAATPKPDDGYGTGTGNDLVWAGDDVVPPIAPVSENGAGATDTTDNNHGSPNGGRDERDAMNSPAHGTAQQFVYDDGLDDAFWSSHQLMSDEDPEAYGIEGPVPPEYETTFTQAAGVARAMTAAEYPQASRFVSAASGNFRPQNTLRTIDKIVIHITDGGPNINGPISWFQNPDAKVSSHYIVGQDGEVVQMVRHNDVAYHARGANSNSIGIEHVANTRGLDPTEAQYCASASLVRWLADSLGIPIDRTHILGHREATTTTKSCPGDWDWDYFMGMVTSATCYPRSAHAQSMSSHNSSTGGSKAQGGGAAVAGAGTWVIERILDNRGDVSWTLDQMKGKKMPADDPAREGPAEYRTRELTVPGPKATTVLGIDEIYVNLRIRYEYNGRTVANVAQAVTRSNDAVFQGLDVTSTIHNVAQMFPSASDPNSKAAIKLQIHYRFTHKWEEDAIYLRDLTVFGDGTFTDSGQWTVRP